MDESEFRRLPAMLPVAKAAAAKRPRLRLALAALLSLTLVGAVLVAPGGDSDQNDSNDNIIGPYSYHRLEIARLRAMVAVQDGAAPASIPIQRVLADMQPVPPLDMGARLLALWPSDQRATAAFLAGYRAGQGPPSLAAHFAERVIPLCEWTLGWGVPWYPGNGYLSVAQFHPGTWAAAGGGDPNDLWTVGRNVANWLNTGIDPGSTAGWPTCWWR